MRKKYTILFITVISIIIMAIVEVLIKPNYAMKSLIKIICFCVIPIIISRINKTIDVKSFLKFSKKSLKTALTLGVFIYLLIFIGYLIANNFYNFSSITSSLNETLGINKNNFIFVALYISFINSLLEEFFFRGFAFTNLKHSFTRKNTYIVSSFLFAIYHIAIMNSWFNIYITILILIGLFIGGLIFNYFNEKENNIYISWLIHMFANFSINTIGFILLTK